MTAPDERTLPFESAAWGPSAVSALDLEVLADFTGLSTDACLERLDAYRLEDMAEAWRRERPSSADEIRAFYAATDHYLWELLGWHGSGNYAPYLARIDELAARWPPDRHPRALDYGCGVGTAAIRLAERGYAVTIADVPGRTLDFAKARLRARGLPFDLLEIVEDVPRLPAGRWDVVVCFDVLEHVPNPGEVARALVRALARGGGAAIVASFDVADERFPHHLAEGTAEFGGHRWAMYLQRLGLLRVGDLVYRRVGPLMRLAQRLNYELWRRTGLVVRRLER